MRALLICLMLLTGIAHATEDCNTCCKKAKVDAFIEKSIEIGRNGDLDGALLELDKAMALDSENAMVLSVIAGVYFAKNDDIKAIAYCDKAINANKLTPTLNLSEYSGLYASKGIAYARLHKYDEAIQNYSESLNLKPIDVWTYKHRAEAYVETQQFLKALKDYNHIIEIDEEGRKVIIEDIAKIHLKVGNYQKAMEASKEARGLGVEMDEDFYTELETLRKNY